MVGRLLSLTHRGSDTLESVNQIIALLPVGGGGHVFRIPDNKGNALTYFDIACLYSER